MPDVDGPEPIVRALRAAQRRFVAAEQALASARRDRLLAITEAHKQGMSWRAIGRVLGLSGPRVHQLAGVTDKAIAGRSTRYSTSVRPRITVAITEALAAAQAPLSVDELRPFIARALGKELTDRGIHGALAQLERERVVVPTPDQEGRYGLAFWFGGMRGH